MEDLYSLILACIDELMPDRMKEWIFRLPKTFRYTLIGLLYVFALAVFGVVIILLVWLYDKITGLFL